MHSVQKHWIIPYCGDILNNDIWRYHQETLALLPQFTLLFVNALSVISGSVCQNQQSQLKNKKAWIFGSENLFWLDLASLSQLRTWIITTEDLWETWCLGIPGATVDASAAGSPFYLISLNVNAVGQCIIYFKIPFRYRKMNSTGKTITQSGFDLTRMVLLNKHWPIHLKDNLLKESTNKGMLHSKH